MTYLWYIFVTDDKQDKRDGKESKGRPWRPPLPLRPAPLSAGRLWAGQSLSGLIRDLQNRRMKKHKLYPLNYDDGKLLWKFPKYNPSGQSQGQRTWHAITSLYNHRITCCADLCPGRAPRSSHRQLPLGPPQLWWTRSPRWFWPPGGACALGIPHCTWWGGFSWSWSPRLGNPLWISCWGWKCLQDTIGKEKKKHITIKPAI